MLIDSPNENKLANKKAPRLLLVGNPEEHHVGAHFFAAAEQLGLAATLLDVRKARSRNVWINRLFHRVGRRPPYLNQFSRNLIKVCRYEKPDILLVTGISAPHLAALEEIGSRGIHRVNYLTDDPWSRRNGAAFFWSALKGYDIVWSPRRANLGDLRRQGCRRAEYLPFAYNPTLHFPELPNTETERRRFACDVAFVGGADSDRIPLAAALATAALKMQLYGGYWDRVRELRPHWRGFVYGRELRQAVGGGTVNICVGRKENRDGHAMRSLELPAMGACIVVEDTAEHRTLFGAEGDCVVYFRSLEDLLNQVKALCNQPVRARLLGQKVFHRICEIGHHTYVDRLCQMLEIDWHSF